MLGHINCELNDSDLSEVTEDWLRNEADQTTVNRHMNCILQLALLFKMSVRMQSLAYNVYTVLIIIIIKYLDRKITSEK